MNSLIMDWSSAHVYDGSLVASEEAANRSINDFSSSQSQGIGDGKELTESPVLLFIDTAGCDMRESSQARLAQSTGARGSKWND